MQHCGFFSDMKILWEISPAFEQMGVGVGKNIYKCYMRIPKAFFSPSVSLSVVSLFLSRSSYLVNSLGESKCVYPEIHLHRNVNRSTCMSKRVPRRQEQQDECILPSENPCPISWEVRHIPSFVSPISFFFLTWIVKFFLNLFFTSWHFF